MTTSSSSADPVSGEQRLFDPPERPVMGAPEPAVGRPRMKSPVRDQQLMCFLSLDERVPPDSPVRAVWDLVAQADLSELFAKIQAVEGGPGRNPINPRILMCLWLFATVEGISRAREIERLTQRDLMFQWICGGVSVNRTTLSAFYTACPELLSQTLTDHVAALMQANLVNLNRVALDGMRTRANAGKSSFRRDPTLEELQRDAREQVERLARERQDKDHSGGGRPTVKESDAADRLRRVAAAREALAELAQTREARKKGDGVKTRVSTTDPDARNMKMANGGFNPAFNVQFATAAGSDIIVGVDVNNLGSDAGLMEPMVLQVRERFGQVPGELLVDGGYVAVDDITDTTLIGTTIIAPVKEEAAKRAKGIDPFQPLDKDSPEVGDWRRRMGLPETKEIYKERASTAELINAQARNRNLQQFTVRGLVKVKIVAMWHALAHNLMRGLSLRIAAAKAGT